MTKKNITVLAALVAAVALTIGVKAVTANDDATGKEKTAANMTIDLTNTTHVLLETSLGDIELALYNETPQHRDNFVKLVNEGTYDGVLFHRVINNFMIQTGDPDSKTATTDAFLGGGGPGYDLPAEIVYPKLFHKRGALAAARKGDETNPERRSSGSQFYIVTGRRYSEYQLNAMLERLADQSKAMKFQSLVREHMGDIETFQSQGDSTALQNLQDKLISQTEDWYTKNPVQFTQQQIDAYSTVGGTPHLDGAYTVFGEVVRGMDVVDKIQNVSTGKNDRPVDDVRIIKAKILNVGSNN